MGTGHLISIDVLGNNTVSITLTDFHCAFYFVFMRFKFCGMSHLCVYVYVCLQLDLLMNNS
jgi:hypothetical protein